MGSVHLLSGIIKQSTGQFAEKYLFELLGIKNYEWNRDPKGYPYTVEIHAELNVKMP